MCIEEYARESIELSKQCPIIKVDDGFVLQRKSVHTRLENSLDHYEKQKKNIHAELRHHSADLRSIRLELTLAKLKTYLGLVRISELSITKDQ